jgi:hypothetical protein
MKMEFVNVFLVNKKTFTGFMFTKWAVSNYLKTDPFCFEVLITSRFGSCLTYHNPHVTSKQGLQV